MVQTIVPTIISIITEKMTQPCRMRWSIRPYISTRQNGNTIMANVVKKFVIAVGFSKG